MKYVVLFEDNVGTGELRTRHMPDHLDFLDNNASAILAAGPLVDTNDSVSGGLWLVEASDEPEARSLVESDPLWSTGLRKSAKICRWAQVFADGKRLERVQLKWERFDG